VIAICSIIAGPMLAVARFHVGIKSILPASLAGSIFILGFVLLGIAINSWHLPEWIDNAEHLVRN
jgi:hypothetical protein